MKQVLKTWLWLVLIVNVLTAITLFTTALQKPITFLTLIGAILLISGISLMLFMKKKLGYYLMCVAALVIFISNTIQGINILWGLSSMIISPLITYFLMKSDWESFN